VALHGGSGAISRASPRIPQYTASLTEILTLAKEFLSKGESALDVVEKVVRYLEDNELFNAGKGSVLDENGNISLEASIMDDTLHCGAVTQITTVKNPISLARKVMECTPHVILAGVGAEKFALNMHMEPVKPNYFYTAERQRQLESEKQKHVLSGDLKKADKETVGCVVIDMHGHLAAGTSTGGRTNKMEGRIGDSPIIGSGTYCSDICAVSGTGNGEQFIRYNVAYQVNARIQFGKETLKNAANTVVFNVLSKGDGGLIAVDNKYNIVCPFNAEGMFHGIANSKGLFKVSVWDQVDGTF